MQPSPDPRRQPPQYPQPPSYPQPYPYPPQAVDPSSVYPPPPAYPQTPGFTSPPSYPQAQYPAVPYPAHPYPQQSPPLHNSLQPAANEQCLRCPVCSGETYVPSALPWDAPVRCSFCGHDYRTGSRAGKGRRNLLIGLGIGGSALVIAGLVMAGILFDRDRRQPELAHRPAEERPAAEQPAAVPQVDSSEVDPAPNDGIPEAPAELPDADRVLPPGREPPLPEADPANDLPPLRYSWKSDRPYKYYYTLEATVGERIVSYSGFSSFTAGVPGMQVEQRPSQGSGSAFVIAADGHLLTCHHVVDGATQIDVHLGGKKFSGKVLAEDRQLDVALIKIDAQGLSVLSLADGQKVELGQEVRSVGYPLSDVLGESVKMNRGTVSGFSMREGRSVFQIDASINPGNSGGPVVDSRGRVVGMASEKLYGSQISHVGFCVPADEIRRWLAGKAVQASVGGESAELSGPDLARKVTPGVAFLRVVTGRRSDGKTWDLTSFYSSLSSYWRSKNPFSAEFIPSQHEHDQGGRLQVDDLGQVLDDQNTLSMPMLMGPVVGLTVEPLSSDGRRNWKTERQINIVREQEQPRDNVPFLGFPLQRPGGFRSPFDRQPPKTKIEIIQALQSCEYKITEFSATIVTINKRMRVAQSEKAKHGLEMSAAGTLTFDREQGVMQSAALEGAYSVASDSVTVRIPLKLDYKPYVKPAEPAAEATKEMNPQIKADLDALAAETSDSAAKMRALVSLASANRDKDSRAAVVNAVAELLDSQESELRVQAIKTLTHWDWSTKVGHVIPLIEHADAATRAAAIEYLGEMRDADAAEPLAARMAIAGDRPQVAAALRVIGPTAEPAVIGLLKHSEAAVRIEACAILAEIGGEDSVATLRRLAQKSDPASSAAKEALTSLGYSTAPPAKKKSTPAVDDDENPFAPAAKKPKPPAEDDNENPFEAPKKKPKKPSASGQNKPPTKTKSASNDNNK